MRNISWMIGSLIFVAACNGSTVAPDAGRDVASDSAADSSSPQPTTKVDLLVLADNSNSMRDNQNTFGTATLPAIINALVSPPCTDATDPSQPPHTCDPANANDHPVYPPVTSLNLGVIDSDLGTPGAQVPGCDDSMVGDDGLLNPIRYGSAESHHEPWGIGNPSAFGRPIDCDYPDEFPPFINYDSTRGQSLTTFVHDTQCNMMVYCNGCGLESQLDSVWRALVLHGGPGGPNAGFVRDDAVLAIVLLTDEEDGSVRNCAYAGSTASDNCMPEALDVYTASSTNWSNPNLNLRFYMYQPGGPQDPTWSLDRYVSPGDPSHGLFGVKPGHPERVIFAAITGVPLTGWQNADGSTNWDALLGTPGPNGANDFVGRDTTTAIDTMSAEGPISMRQANLDAPNCPERTVPACRRQGSTYTPTACTTDVQYFAWPSRRIVEVARRFDEVTFCGGAACRDGMVFSICKTSYDAFVGPFVARIGQRLAGQ